MSAGNPTTIALSLPEEQLQLLQTIQEQNAKLLAAMNAAVWLSEEEAAERVKISVSLLRKWRTDGWLRYHKIEKVVLFKTAELDADVEAKGFVQASLSPLMKTVTKRSKA
ncbi:helix-turn-helix domain-containing protein [Runella slithyformis]|uniref:Helix-turn-helix domain-containing protein n=1 Tax=Runella slithyformis (strain ATCC 29530 / DSM 19594 / LMG 11500 / NCIMB 11436 / LSU 4) TaxID=761193 RepID=A0A7U3ZGF7_RUNSL|nr:helix-turn-helix domain-containing protein [Runella slithyformis]AEI46757.1 hypothetical protein Runsl_0305 [Runella slithyformis DSM 19594]